MIKKVAFALCLVALTSFVPKPVIYREKFPYKSAGLTEQQAAAHLLNRFTFGPTPGQVDEVVKVGIEKWFDQQLDGNASEKEVENMLVNYATQHLSNTELAGLYVRNGQAAKMAMKEGVIKDSVNKEDKKEYRAKVKQYIDAKG